ncbi:ribosome production factor 1 [Aspergillus japonicus CBS 114.51]|uniref:Ribosome production factor 1 n=2 Tax=Aspergillus TaxID=5052 RepID=A0A2V5IQL0_ASPV1|nr:ribosome production factor 1 [Aspergillus japonicus CBS 114.51]PYI22156.1 ribosome production factor 1 [Aspergillus violaceofuscus CBS 115571]RAH83912.1 ribosome production factor 1 [Aspergillus japonicus CBS 114.51]
MGSGKALARPPPDASMELKPRNKLRRQMLHIKRKRAKDSARRTERYAFKKEEAKNPRLKEERLKRNIPLTIDRKRVWDDAGSDVEDGLGLSVDVERIKRRKQEEEDELNRSLENPEKSGDEESQDDDDEDDDVDSMLASSDDEEEDNEDDREGDEDEKADDSRGRRKSALPSATERATSPSRVTKSTNLSLVPDALAAKFPSLFNLENPSPKILITTSLNSTLHHEAELLTDLFPNSHYVRRTRHRFAHQFSIREIAKFASNRNYTALVILREDQKKPTGLDIVHLPTGPMFHFSMSNWVEGKRIPGHGNATDHFPELILNNFRTPLGLLTAHLFRTLFPAQPEVQGRQVVTVLNSRDYLFFRRHRYVFREKRETEKAVVGADGKEMKGAEGIRAGMQELGPRFTLKLRRIDKGIQRASGQEWEWKGGMEKTRTKFQL